MPRLSSCTFALAFAALLLAGRFVGIAGAAVMIGGIIFLHELGHFLAAKRMGMPVEVFSLGFGPRLLGFRWKETDVRLSALPLGGYVKLAGYNPEEPDAEDPYGFLKQPARKRLEAELQPPAGRGAERLGLGIEHEDRQDGAAIGRGGERGIVGKAQVPPEPVNAGRIGGRAGRGIGRSGHGCPHGGGGAFGKAGHCRRPCLSVAGRRYLRPAMPGLSRGRAYRGAWRDPPPGY